MTGLIVLIDLPLFLAINTFARATPWLHAIVAAYANDGIVLFAVPLLAGWWTARSRPSQVDPVVMVRALWAPLGMLLALGINQLIVAAVHEPRPYATVPGILVLAHRGTDPSFPSDHAVMAGAVAAGLFLLNRWLGWLSSLAAVLMAFARVYIAAHYPHDVAAGLLVGAVLSLLGYLALHRIVGWLVRLVEQTALRPLVTTAAPLPY
jgi:undecaprenyl-diphosphatase